MTTPVLYAIGLLVAVSIFRSFLIRGKTSWRLYQKGSLEPLSPAVAFLSIFASLCGGFLVFGLVQLGFEGGLSGYILGAAYVLGLPLLSWALHESKITAAAKGYFGIDEVIRRKYGPYTLFCFFALNAVVFTGVLGAQFLAISFYLRSFPGLENLVVVLAIGLIPTIGYTVYHGFRGVIANDIIQGLCAFAVSFIVPFTVYMHVRTLPSISFTPLSELGGSYGLAYPIFGFLFLFPSFIIRADIWQRMGLVRPEHQRRVLIWVALALVWFYISMTSTGLIIRQRSDAFGTLHLSDPGRLVPDIMQTLVGNPVVQVIGLAGILFAILSSVDSYLNIVALSLTKLLLWNLRDDEETGKADRVFKVNAQVTTLVVAILALVSAVLIPDFIDLLSASFSLIGILLPVGGWALLKPDKVNRDITGAVPLTVSLVLLIALFPVLRKLAFVPAVLVGFLVFAVLVFLDGRRKKISPEVPHIT
jgi:Na+/proline symporter